MRVVVLTLLAFILVGSIAPPAAMPVFSHTLLLDPLRAGGEPVVQITPSGAILVAAHPGWTHTRVPPSPQLLAPATEAESYMWRSDDGGLKWVPAGVIPQLSTPKGAWVGMSDPDFALGDDGTIYFSDLDALAFTGVVRSIDDGHTWLPGDPAIAGPIDRQWLAAHGTDVWLIGNWLLEGERVMKSSDGGLTWTKISFAHCGNDISAGPDGTLYIGCENGMDVSTDGGLSWTRRYVPGTGSSGRSFAEPAIDAAGNVYVSWTQGAAGGTHAFVAMSPDKGATWRSPIDVSAPLGFSQFTSIWPWVVAGDAGRVAVAWLGTPAGGNPASTNGDWFVYESTVLGADSSTPTVLASQASDVAIHHGPVCQQGLNCQTNLQASGDRRLGDFFEMAADASGRVHLAFPTTTFAPTESVAHPGYVRQIGGALLRAT